MTTLVPLSLRRHRIGRKLTQAGLAARTGMSAQHVSDIEGGKRDARLSSIERLANAMGLSVLLVPESMAPELRRYIDNKRRSFVNPVESILETEAGAPHEDRKQ